MTGGPNWVESARSGGPDSERTKRGQSEVVGVVLLTGVVVIAASLVGIIVLQGVAAEGDDGPTIDIVVNSTTEFVTIDHNGGATVDVSSVEVIVSGESRERYPLSSFSQQRGTDATVFEPGDRWRRSNDVGGDSLRVMVIHTPSGTVLQDVTVTPAVTVDARFSYSPSQPTSLDTVTFDAGDSRVEAGATIDSYEWDFDGDNTTDATGETASHSFPDNGTYPVTLTVTTTDGRTDNRTREIQVYNVFPTANYTYSPSAPKPGQSVAFDGTNSTDPDGTLVSYEWDFDGNGTVDATGSSNTTSYDSDGNYTARLTVTDNDGAVDSRSQVITVVKPAAPTVSITSTTITAQGNSGKYDVDVTFEATDPENDIANYTVSLYDTSSKTVLLDSVPPTPYDGSSTTETVSDTDGTAGESPLYVVVEVRDSRNDAGTAATQVAEGNQNPTASFTFTPTEPTAGQTVSFDASGSSDPESSSLTYAWDFDNDGTTDATGVQANTSFASTGSYPVKLTVSDGSGGSSTLTKTVEVGSGTGSGTPPTIDKFFITDSSTTTGNSKEARFDVDWNVSDESALQNVTISMARTDGTQVDSQSQALSGTSASGSVSLADSNVQGNPSGNQYDITIVVYDDTGQRTTQTKRVTVG